MTTTQLPSPDVEARLADLETRLRTVECRTGVPAPQVSATPATPAPSTPAPPPAPAAPATPPRAAVDLERLLGGRVLAWVGAVAVLAGLALLFALGVSEGWIDPSARVTLGAGLSVLLVGAGVWLQERRGRTDAACAAAAAGFGGLFLADTVATRVYELLDPVVGLMLAACIAVATAVVAIRWRAQVIGAVGIVGALLAPILAGLPFTGSTGVFLLIAACGATFVLVYERWTWLAFAVLFIPAIQWAPELLTGSWQAYGIAAVLLGFGAVNAAAALGVDLRTRALEVRTPSAYLLACNSMVLAVVGAQAFWDLGGRDSSALWLLGLAAAHVAVAFGVRIRARELSLLAITMATLLGNAALVAAGLDTTLRIFVWAGSAVAMAVAARHRKDIPGPLLACGLGGQLALATVSTLLQIKAGGLQDDGEVIVALAALAAACLVSGRLSSDRPHWRMVLDGAGLIVLAALGLAAFDGVALTLAWAGLAGTLAQVARRQDDDLAFGASWLFMGGALIWCVVDQAPPTALLDGGVKILSAVVGLAAVAAALISIARATAHDRTERDVLFACVAGIVLYLASVALVALTASGQTVAGDSSQLALSAFWTLTGVVALVVGLKVRLKAVRLAALALLALAISKVFLFDLATLDALPRVGSFLALGLLLLLAAFAYQRMRPDTAHADG